MASHRAMDFDLLEEAELQASRAAEEEARNTLPMCVVKETAVQPEERIEPKPSAHEVPWWEVADTSADNQELNEKASVAEQAAHELVKGELELEAIIERRHWAAVARAARSRGQLGAKLTAASVTGKTARQQGDATSRRMNFCDLMNKLLQQLYRVAMVHDTFEELSKNLDHISWAVALSIAALLLTTLLPHYFDAEADQAVDKIVASLQGIVTVAVQYRASYRKDKPEVFTPFAKFRPSLMSFFQKLRTLPDHLGYVGQQPKSPEQMHQEADDSTATLREHVQDLLRQADDLFQGADATNLVLSNQKLRECLWHLTHINSLTPAMAILGGPSLRTSLLSMSQLLYELRSCYQAATFQQRYQELRQQARQLDGEHLEMVQMTFMVHRQVLPKYGFPPTKQGVEAMRWEVGFWADHTGSSLGCQGDKAICKLRRDIHMTLEMDVVKANHTRLPMFHTVGDSHSSFGWPSCVIQHWQGPLLCYNVDRVDLKNLHPPIREGDAVCFCFGEIDCRCHVYKHITEQKSYQDVIDGIIQRYFDHLRSQVKLLPSGVRIFLYNVPPPVRKCHAELNVQFPYLGEDEERKAYVQYFNECLKKESKRSSFRFFDVYDMYSDAEGYLAQEYSDGNVHIADGIWIDEVIRDLKLRPFRYSQIALTA